MASLVESVNYAAINITYTATNGFYVIMFTSQAYKLQNNTTIYGQIITAGVFFVKAQYICSVKVYINWYCNQHPQHHVITVPTRTTLHQRLEVNAVTDFCLCPVTYTFGYCIKICY